MVRITSSPFGFSACGIYRPYTPSSQAKSSDPEAES
jgi:hypothetical protein